MLNHAEGLKRENFEKFSISLSFFDVKTYEKLTFFIIYSDWDKIMLNQEER